MIDNILRNYNIEGTLINVKEIPSGNINKTYIAEFNENGETKKYLIQRINTNVFHEPYKLMKNIEGVTEYLRRQASLENDTSHKTLEIVKTKDRQLLTKVIEDEVSSYYRVYKYIDNSISYDKSTDLEVVYNTGKAFGNFQRLLNGYPMKNLTESIKDFHNTKKRFEKLVEDIKIDAYGRVMEVAPEIVFILKRADLCNLIVDRLGHEIPYRVTHNDTKVNNVMINKDTNDYLAVIDLDTVMPGSLLYDYGDGIRSTASNAAEDDTNLDNVYINMDLFKSYTKGFLSEMVDTISKEELNMMGESIRILTLELAIRFLNDYINGDTYFKINYKKHNLDRTRNQIKLVEDIENKLNEINKFIKDSYEELKRK